MPRRKTRPNIQFVPSPGPSFSSLTIDKRFKRANCKRNAFVLVRKTDIKEARRVHGECTRLVYRLAPTTQTVYISVAVVFALRCIFAYMSSMLSRQHRFNTDLNSGRKNCWEPGLGSEEAGGKQSSDFWHKTG